MMPDFRKDNPYQRLLSEALRKLDVEVCFAVGYRRVFPFWRAWRSMPKTAVFHLHWLGPYLQGSNLAVRTFYSLKLLVDIALIRASGTGVVWTIHNRVSHEAPWPKLETWVQRRLVKSVDRVIVHTQANLEELRSDFPVPDEKVSVIPHGHYRNAYGPALTDPATARRQLGLPENGRVFLYFGLLRPYKGIERLIGDWQNVMSSESPATLLIAGNAVDQTFLAQILAASSRTNSIVVRPGFVPDSQVPLFFAAADLVVLPFHRVLTSGSLILAMSFGKPVIAPRLGGIAEVLGEAGDLLYAPDDPDGLRSLLARSVTLPLCPLREKIERTCEKLDWAGVAALTADAYRRAVAGRN